METKTYLIKFVGGAEDYQVDASEGWHVKDNLVCFYDDLDCVYAVAVHEVFSVGRV